MNLQNGYKVLYSVAADGKRTFYATKEVTCDPTVDSKIAEVTIGEFKLVYEKDGQIYGSTSGVPAEGDYCFADFNKVFKEAVEESVATTHTKRARKTAVEVPVVEEPTTEAPVVEEEQTNKAE